MDAGLPDSSDLNRMGARTIRRTGIGRGWSCPFLRSVGSGVSAGAASRGVGSKSVEEVPRDIWQDRATPRETRADDVESRGRGMPRSRAVESAGWLMSG